MRVLEQASWLLSSFRSTLMDGLTVTDGSSRKALDDGDHFSYGSPDRECSGLQLGTADDLSIESLQPGDLSIESLQPAGDLSIGSLQPAGDLPLGSPQSSLNTPLSDSSDSSPLADSVCYELVSTYGPHDLEEEQEGAYSGAKLCDKHDGKEEAEKQSLCLASEEPRKTNEGILEQTTPVNVDTRRKSSPWVEGLGWYANIKKLEERVEINKQYEEDVNKVEEKFVASAVMVEPSDLEVRLHAEVDGKTIHGTWFLLHGKLPSSQAWIGLFPHRARKSYAGFRYALGTGGEFSFRGVTPGYYQVRLFGDKFLPSQIAETEPMLVGPEVASFTAQVKAQDEVVMFDYSFDNLLPSSSDWIAIYEKSQRRNKSYLSCTYGNSHGVVQLSLPHLPGKYEARLFTAGSKYNEQATVEFDVLDNDFLTAEQVKGGISVKWAMNRAVPSMTDWIGVYKAGARSTDYVMYVYTHGVPNGEITLRVSKNFPKGSYQVRIFATKVGKYLSHKGCNFIYE